MSVKQINWSLPLPELKQALFTQAYEGLREQGWEQSIRAGSESEPGGVICLYRSPEGRKCAVGHCLTDDEMAELEKANPDINSESSDSVLSGLEAVSKEDRGFYTSLSGFLRDMQRVHDESFNPERMCLRMRDFGAGLGLNVPFDR